MIYVVSGLPRTGTSLMMQMLQAGGLPVMTDAIRQPDGSNPNGYWELEKVKKLRQDDAWLAGAEGKVVKVISMLLYELPSVHHYKVIFMQRHIDEVLASQRRMLERMNRVEDTNPDDTAMRTHFLEHLATLKTWLKDQQHLDVLPIRHKRLFEQPEATCADIVSFIDKPLNQEAMCAAIDPSLYREKKSEQQ